MTTRLGGSPSTATTCDPLAAAPAAATSRPPWALMISLAFGRYSLAYPSGLLTSIWPIRYAGGLVWPWSASLPSHPKAPHVHMANTVLYRAFMRSSLIHG